MGSLLFARTRCLLLLWLVFVVRVSHAFVSLKTTTTTPKSLSSMSLLARDGYQSLYHPIVRSNIGSGINNSDNNDNKLITKRLSSLYSSNNDDDDTENNNDDSKEKMEKKIAGRKKRVTMGHKFVALSYAVITCISLIKYRKVPVAASFIAAGPLMASVTAWNLVVLPSSSNIDHSKRLNLALLCFGILGLIGKDIITTAPWLWIVTCLVAVINSTKGYGYGLKGWELKRKEGKSNIALLLEDILGEMKSFVSTITNVKSSSVYYATITFAIMKLTIFYNIVQQLLLLVSSSSWNYPLFCANIFRFKKLHLLTVAAFTIMKEGSSSSNNSSKNLLLPLKLGLGFSTSAIAALCITQKNKSMAVWMTFLALFSIVDAIKTTLSSYTSKEKSN